MTKTFRKRQRTAFLFLLMFVFFILSAVNLEKLKRYDDIYYISESSNGISAEDAASYFKEAEKSVAFYCLKGTATIKNDKLFTEAETKIIAACGRSDLILMDCLRLDFDDRGFCIIGRRDAYELFGSTDVIGLQVTYGENHFQIVDVSEEVEHIFLYQAEVDSGLLFDRVCIQCDANDQVNALKRFQENYFMVDTYMENYFILWLLQMYLMIVPLMMIMKIIKTSIRKSHECWATSRIKAAIFGLCAVHLVMAAVLMLIVFVQYPYDMIPPTWSDFTFWRALYESKINSISVFLKCEKTEIEMDYIGYIFKIIVYNILGIYIFHNKLGKKVN